MNTQASLTSRVGVLEMEVQLALAKVGAPTITLAGNVTGPSTNNRVVGLSGDSITKLITQDSGSTIFMQQGGTLAVPTVESFFRIQPRDPTYAPYLFQLSGGPSPNGPVAEWGFNVDGSVAAKPVQRLTMESDFFDGLNDGMEIHFQWSAPPGWKGGPGFANWRPFTTNALANGQGGVTLQCRTAGAGITMADAATGDTFFQGTRNGSVFFNFATLYPITGRDMTGGGVAGCAFMDAAGTVHGSVGDHAADSSVYLWSIDRALLLRVGVQQPFWIDASGRNIQLLGSALPGPAPGDFGNGVGVIGLGQATTAPTANPGVGKWILYSDPATGNLLGRSGLGNTRTIALA